MSPGIKKVVTLGEVGATDGRHHVPLHAREGLVPLVTVLVNPRDLEGTFLRELALRIEGLLRDRPATLARAQRRATTTVCELLIDQDAHRVTVSGEEISLTALEFKLLVALTGRLDRVYPRRALLGDIWESNVLNRTRTVDTQVKRLRDKLKSAGRFIQTVRGVGYRFSETPSTMTNSRGVATLGRASSLRSFA
jgi:DNA-binding winged helix-turn-helix (wHTH) protein